MDLVVTSALASALCHRSFWTGKRKARELKFCQYVWTHARFVNIYFDSSGSTVQVGSRSKNRQKITILNFELYWYFRTWKSICRSISKMCTNMCFIHWDLIRPELMMLGGVTEQKPYIRLLKMTVKKMKIGQKSFFGRIFDFLDKSDTENPKFAKNFAFWTMFTRDTGPQNCKMTKKVINGPKVIVWFFCVFG